MVVKCQACYQKHDKKGTVLSFVHKQIIKLRYGCLCPQNIHPYWPCAMIAEALNVNEWSVRRVLARWQRSKDVKKLDTRNAPTKRRPKRLSETQIARITSPETLQQDAAKTLKERVVLI